MSDKILCLTNNEKAEILDGFMEKIDNINKTSGTIFGSYQILQMIDRIAIEKGYVECPCCHTKKTTGKS